MKTIETPYGTITRDGKGPEANMLLSVPAHLRSALFWANVERAAGIDHPSFQKVIDLDEENGSVVLEPVDTSLGQSIEHGSIPAGISRVIFMKMLELLKAFEETKGGFIHGYICPAMIFQRSGFSESPYSVCLGFSPGIRFGDQVLRDRNHPQYVPPEIYDEQEYHDKNIEERVSPLADVYLLGFTVMELLAGNRLDDFFVDPVLGQVHWEVAKREVEGKAELILSDIPDVDGKMKEAIRSMIRKRVEERPRRAERILKELKSPYVQRIDGPILAHPLVLKSDRRTLAAPPVLERPGRGPASANVAGEEQSFLHDDERSTVAWSVLLRRNLRKPYVAWPAMAFAFVLFLVLAASLLGPVKFRFDPVHDVVRIAVRKDAAARYRPLKSDAEGYYRLEPGTYDFSIRSGGLTLFEKRLTLNRSKKLFEKDGEFDFEGLTVPVFFDLQTDTFMIFINGREVDWKRGKIRFPEGRYEIVAISRTKISDLIRFTADTSDDSILVDTPLEGGNEAKERESVEEDSRADETENTAENATHQDRDTEKNTIYIHDFRWNLPDQDENVAAKAIADFLADLYSLALPSWDRFLPGEREKRIDLFFRRVCDTPLTPDEVRGRIAEMKREIYSLIMQAVDSMIEEDSSDRNVWVELLRTVEHWQGFERDDLRFYDNLGFLFLKIERWEDAEKSFTAAIDGGMEKSSLYERRCTAREKSNKWDEAREDVLDAMRLDPGRREELLLREASILVLRGEWMKKQSSDPEASFREGLEILDSLAAKRPDDLQVRRWRERALENLIPYENTPVDQPRP